VKFDLAKAPAAVGAAKLRLFGKINSSTERPTVAVYAAASAIGRSRASTGTAARR
jgi:hypothetical protein